jgi:hypothetical protein
MKKQYMIFYMSDGGFQHGQVPHEFRVRDTLEECIEAIGTRTDMIVVEIWVKE